MQQKKPKIQKKLLNPANLPDARKNPPTRNCANRIQTTARPPRIVGVLGQGIDSRGCPQGADSEGFSGSRWIKRFVADAPRLLDRTLLRVAADVNAQDSYNQPILLGQQISEFF
jgi:hypothetical protein